MSGFKEVGYVDMRQVETEIQWKIPEALSFAEFKDIECPVFYFAGTEWRLRLKSSAMHETMVLCLWKKNMLKCSVEYSFLLRKADGSVEHLNSGVYQSVWTVPCYIELSEIQQRKSELTISGAIVILCTLKCKTSYSDHPRSPTIPDLWNIPDVPKQPKSGKLIKLETLSENFKNLFLNKESCDTTLYVMNKEYKAHKTVLMARSSVFAAMFLHETSEKKTGTITISDCDPESFKEFLEFLYTGKLESISCSSALQLYETSDKCDVQELKVFCSKFLIEKMTVDSFCDVVVIADKYDDEKLLSSVQCFFNENLSSILVTPEWDCLLKNHRRLANKMLIEMSKVKE